MSELLQKLNEAGIKQFSVIPHYQEFLVSSLNICTMETIPEEEQGLHSVIDGYEFEAEDSNSNVTVPMTCEEYRKLAESGLDGMIAFAKNLLQPPPHGSQQV